MIILCHCWVNKVSHITYGYHHYHFDAPLFATHNFCHVNSAIPILYYKVNCIMQPRATEDMFMDSNMFMDSKLFNEALSEQSSHYIQSKLLSLPK